MMAVQAFLRQMVEANLRDARSITPEIVANGLHAFFRTNFAEVSYMTALICIHSPPSPDGAGPEAVSYITCGAPDLVVIDPVAQYIVPVNPDRRGGLPIGLIPDTEYSAADTVVVELPRGMLCAAVTDGLLDISRDGEGSEKIPRDLLKRLGFEVLEDACELGSLVAAPYKFAKACVEFGYDKFNDAFLTCCYLRKIPGNNAVCYGSNVHIARCPCQGAAAFVWHYDGCQLRGIPCPHFK